MWVLSERTLGNLIGVEPALTVDFAVSLSRSKFDAAVIEGVRDIKRQEQLVLEGKSQTMRSRHLYGKAIDIMMYDENGKGTWEKKYYKYFADLMKETAKAHGHEIEWGGDWKTFYDGPHFQVPW